jgi:hypothetical protein
MPLDHDVSVGIGGERLRHRVEPPLRGSRELVAARLEEHARETDDEASGFLAHRLHLAQLGLGTLGGRLQLGELAFTLLQLLRARLQLLLGLRELLGVLRALLRRLLGTLLETCSVVCLGAFLLFLGERFAGLRYREL